MLASLPDRPPSLTDPALVYEPKFDGIRAIVEVVPGEPRAIVRIWSRLGNEKSAQFPDVVDAVAAWGQSLEGPVVLDGEVEALDAEGHPAGFQRLQNRIHVSVPGYRSKKPMLAPDQQPAALIVFDLLRQGDTDLRPKPLSERRGHLDRLFDRHPPPSTHLRLTEHVAADGRALMARAVRDKWEGLLVKYARSPYRSGKRSAEWLKYKLQMQDEFIVGGWTAPKGSRAHFGALILGIPTGPQALRTSSPQSLRYVGDVGTGFTDAELERIWHLLRRLETPTCPFVTPPKTKETAHWVRPQLVVQVRYTEMTDDGRLRHPAYLGFRDDVEVKKPPAYAKATAGQVRRQALKPSSLQAPSLTPQDVAALIAQLDDFEKRRKGGRLVLPGNDWLEVTNLHKIFWPQGPRTKGDLLRHYVRVAPLILPVVSGRPLVMKRLPNGVDGPAFYQHRAPEPVPDGVRIETLPDDDVPARLVGGALKTLLYMAQLASVSMDPWFSSIDALDTPDQVAIDLDPQPGATFSDILDVARWVHDELVKLHVPSFPKTSGSEGLHIFIPLPPGTPYDAGMLFCQIVATLVAAKHPKVATVERSVGKRKVKTIYVDYLQNIQGKTLACAYSARASAFAGVSTPLTWEEVDAAPAPQDFTVATIEARVTRVGDLWTGLRNAEGADLLGALDTLRSR